VIRIIRIGHFRAEIAAALDTEDLRRRFPPILTVPQLAELLQRSRKTIYCWIEKGRLDGTFRKRGKGHLLWRDRVLDRVFNGPEWESNDDE
jgi:excisionase family DNA binding protein